MKVVYNRYMKQGFSFISLLVVLIIIGTLCMVFLPQFQKEVKKQHTTQLNIIKQAQQVQEQLNAQAQAQQRMLDNLTGAADRPRRR